MKGFWWKIWKRKEGHLWTVYKDIYSLFNFLRQTTMDLRMEWQACLPPCRTSPEYHRINVAHIFLFLWNQDQRHPLLWIFTSIMAAKGTKSKLAAITTLALPIMFLFAWSRGACGSTGANTHEIQIQIRVYVKHNRMYNIFPPLPRLRNLQQLLTIEVGRRCSLDLCNGDQYDDHGGHVDNVPNVHLHVKTCTMF